MANNAIKEVANSFKSSSSICTEEYGNVDWEELGPIGLPDGGLSKGVGRIHRIEFDPQYDGVSNKTIYASSEHSGLWRSENNGDFWEQVSTDLEIPFTSVSDVTIDKNNSNNLFISTGLADVGLNMNTSSLTTAINPIWTTGIYRSLDYGSTWEPINVGLLSQFDEPGAIRNIETHPTNSHIICAATSEGFFKTENALDTDPVWSLSNSGIGDDQYLRGLCYKPDNPSVIYSSGLDIYSSSNDGNTWSSMTGPGTGLDIESLPENFEVQRINIAVTPANPALLYAYVVGQYETTNGLDSRGYVFKYDGINWEQIEVFDTNGSAYNVINGAWVGIAVSPVEEDFVVIGYTKIRAHRTNGSNFIDIVGYNEYGCHADVHDIKFLPTGTDSDIYIAHHGGISLGEVGSTGLNFSYSYLCNGLSTSTIWTFDVNESQGEAVIIGTQDNGSTYIDDFASNWKQIGGGDGYKAAIADPINPIVYYGVNSLSKRSMFPLGSASGIITPESVQYSCCEADISRSFEEIHVSISGKNYFGFTEVYERLKLEEPGDNWEDVWKYSSDIGLVPIFNDEGGSVNKLWRHKIRPFEVSQRNPEVVYVSVPGYDVGTDEPPFVKPALLKSESGFTEGVHDPLDPTFFDVTPNLPSIPGTGLAPVITGVVTDPYNEDHVWVSFTGYHETLKVWESFDGGDTWVNSDPEGSLHNLPVNDIVVQNGSRNGNGESRLYIATDAGVYVKEPGMDCWMKYGLIPNVRVTKLRLKACENTIYAATYGRGVWKADLPNPSTSLAEVEINEDITWESERFFTNSLRITAGYSLTIKSVLHMPEHGRIVVEPNARLIVDGGTITSGCNTFWQGIELWGDSELPQINNYSGTNSQGILQLTNDGIIENAWVGVTTSGVGIEAGAGGIIDARDGEFLNNYIAVDMKPFQNTHPGTGNPKGNLSKFTETKFTVNDDYIGDLETEWPEAQVKMHGVDGVIFSGCEFVNTSTVSTSEKRSKGIFSVDANYTVQHKCASIPSIYTGCPVEDIIPAVFDGFHRGIEAAKALDALPIKVVQTQFRNNMTGVLLANLDFSEVIKSDFEIGGHPHETWTSGEFRNHLGIYSFMTRCFAIEENDFSKDTESSWDEQNGVLVFQSDENSNNVYLNEFSDLEHGAIGYQVNRDENGVIGLQFNCNDMTNNSTDFVVSRHNGFPNPEGSGIREHQGYLNPLLAAGNNFSLPNGTPSAYTHWDINSDPNYLYIHGAGEAPDANEITPNKIIMAEVPNSNNCPSNYATKGHRPVIGVSGVINEYNQKKSDYYNLLYTYKQMIDDGDTEGTIDDIIATWPEDAWDLYDMLMARSPNNSETVLISAADREIMPHAMLLEVLIANPDALRNGRVIAFVEQNLSNPLPGYMIDILHAASDQRTLRTTMESTLGHHHAEMSRNFNFIIQHYTSDTLNGVHGDSLLYYLEQMDSPTGKYNLAGRLMRIGEITQAMNIIDSIPDNYKLTSYQTDEWKSMQAFFELLEDADHNNRNIASLDSTELVQLEMIATDPDGGIGALRARKALCFFYQNCIPGPALPKNNPSGNKKPLPPLEELLADLNEIQAFPNPASEYITFSFQFFKENAQREILIYNSTGSMVQNFRLDNVQHGQQLWDTRKMKPGSYIYEVIEGERKIHSGKVVIQ